MTFNAKQLIGFSLVMISMYTLILLLVMQEFGASQELMGIVALLAEAEFIVGFMVWKAGYRAAHEAEEWQAVRLQ